MNIALLDFRITERAMVRICGEAGLPERIYAIAAWLMSCEPILGSFSELVSFVPEILRGVTLGWYDKRK